MSLYADYIKERENKDIVETDQGFATYKILHNGECYLQDIYVVPEYRRSGVLTLLADQVVMRAREHGCHTLVGSVCTDDPSATRNTKAILSYGMNVFKTSGNLIFFKKRIE